MKKLKSDNDNQIYAFVRNHQEEKIVVIVNFSSRSFEGKVYLKDAQGSFVELFCEKQLNFQSVEMMLKLEPWAYRVYLPD